MTKGRRLGSWLASRRALHHRFLVIGLKFAVRRSIEGICGSILQVSPASADALNVLYRIKRSALVAAIGVAALVAFVAFAPGGSANGTEWRRVATQSFSASKFLTSSMVGDQDGRITVLTGQEIRRFGSAGSLDPVFSQNAADSIGDFVPFQLGVQPSGKVIVVGTRSTVRPAISLDLIRLTHDGSLDVTFGVDGHASVAIPFLGMVRPISVHVDPLGRILTVVEPGGSEAGYALINRWRAWGALDSGFGEAGFKSVPVQSTAGNVETSNPGSVLTSWSDGSFLLDSGYGWTKYLANGLLDVTYGNAGTISVSLPTFNGEPRPWTQLSAKPVALEDNRLIAVTLAADTTEPSLGTHFVITRYNGFGVLDQNFAGTGAVVPSVSFGDGQADRALLLGGVQRVGSWITVSGAAVSLDQSVLLRVSVDGALDPAFGAGVLRTVLGGACDAHVATALSVTCLTPVVFPHGASSVHAVQRYEGNAPPTLSTPPLPPVGGRSGAGQVPEPDVSIPRRPSA